jgi:hypothetical protein
MANHLVDAAMPLQQLQVLLLTSATTDSSIMLYEMSAQLHGFNQGYRQTYLELCAEQTKALASLCGTDHAMATGLSCPSAVQSTVIIISILELLWSRHRKTQARLLFLQLLVATTRIIAIICISQCLQ